MQMICTLRKVGVRFGVDRTCSYGVGLCNWFGQRPRLGLKGVFTAERIGCSLAGDHASLCIMWSN